MDEKTRNDFEELFGTLLGKKLDEVLEAKFVPFFLKGYEDVIEPQLEDLHEGQKKLKEGQVRLEKGQVLLNHRLESMDKKLDLILDKQLEQNVKNVQLERRVAKLENSKIAT